MNRKPGSLSMGHLVNGHLAHGNPKGLDAGLRWDLRGRMGCGIVALLPNTVVRRSRSGKKAMQRLPLANREEELALFDAMIVGTTGERILLLEARNTLGKSTLMKEFMRRSPDEVTCIPLDLKGDPGLHEVLARLCDGLGWDAFPTFAARVEELGREGKRAAELARYEHVHQKDYNWKAVRDLMIDAFKANDLDEFCFYNDRLKPARDHFPTRDANLHGMVKALIEFCQQRPSLIDELLEGLREERFEKYKEYHALIYGVDAKTPPHRETGLAARAGIEWVEIRYALWAADEGDRAGRRVELTRALFDDLGTRPGRVVFLFDTFDEGSPEVQGWLAQIFLAHAHRATDLVVVIAGQEVPEESIEWAACCQHRILANLDSAEAWDAYSRSKGWDMPRAWIEGYCAATHGNPSQMDKLLSAAQSGG